MPIRFNSRKKSDRDDTLLYDRGLVDVTQAAAFLGISRSHLYSLMESGQLIYSKLGKARRIPKRALIELARSNSKGGWSLETR